jgi:hypothetical protein
MMITSSNAQLQGDMLSQKTKIDRLCLEACARMTIRFTDIYTNAKDGKIILTGDDEQVVYRRSYI